MESLDLPTKEQALPGRETRMPVSDKHFVNGNDLKPPFCESMQQIIFGLGCFWGAERKFWQLDGVYTTALSSRPPPSKLIILLPPGVYQQSLHYPPHKNRYS